MESNQFDERARSPWSPLADVKTVMVSPSEKRMNGSVTIPGSKSLTNRALIISALANGRSKITGILKSDDSYWCIDSLRKLGIEIEIRDNTVFIEGKGGEWNSSSSLYIGAAGTIARFLPGALALSNNGAWEIEASESMSKRPISPLIDALQELGADISYLNEMGYYPISIKGKELSGGHVSLSGKLSSQFISGILIPSPYAKGSVNLNIKDYIVQHSYVYLTLQLMEKFGAQVVYDNKLEKIVINPSHYMPQELELEADASTACYFLALAALTNGKIRIRNLTYETKQPDIKMVDILKRMGCNVTKGPSFIELEGAAQLKGGFEISMREMSDQTLTLAAIAPFADGPITIKDVEHIRYHESDRISAICYSLTELGIKVEEYRDGLKVYPGNPKPALLHTFDDHRVAMSLALIGSKIEGISLNDPGCVSKTCPHFFDMLENLGLKILRTKG
ncbi:3-phosphoshikimate 1-carboxyvinyltransferase [Sporosarcina sp. NCCP-2222]|uniref:3-phosphoshikimate 1-carboxyvinyltransferase n=1 Tax=Sporosarcina sp. NCCP-2222 TaxID=2935073 RepID=UPI00207F3E61|nr:3-phosphoshikimate 1-carboxyvinyltransferase [Sporosarcina sp. NCCP-2222]GKV57523.1 3-phosphoshikimate 1-carboxyvinyltransferase [Sporosarcina sp. NCCP-2222]